MERLTDKKTVSDLRRNYEALQAVGQPRDIGTERYLKLGEYEDIEELFLNLSPHLEKWQIISVRYAMIKYISELKEENGKLKDFIRMILEDIKKYLPETNVEHYTAYRGIDIEELLKEGD
jgi:hypothetical protein